jgi:ribonuclease HII
VIGCDESGTGAWAGPFTVCAFLARVEDAALLREVGARDSKTLSHAQRSRLLDELAAISLQVGFVEVPSTYRDQRAAWRGAMQAAVSTCFAFLHDDVARVTVQIDGTVDEPLRGYLSRTWGVQPEFIPRGDQLIPHIGAASIVAKVFRTECMAEAHALYPQYGWSSERGHGNEGYGTVEHRRAIERYGVTPLHRRVRPLLPYFSEQEGSDGPIRHGG